MKELEELLKKEQQLINSINEKEQQRMKMLPELIRVNNINGKADKMLDLVKYCEGSHAEQIVKIHTELTETLRVLAKESKLNNDLVRQALSVVNYRLNILSGARVETTYAGKGNERVVNTRSCLNFEA
jgi:flagellar biosynthesis/type III secretory pathway chaperone